MSTVMKSSEVRESLAGDWTQYSKQPQSPGANQSLSSCAKKRRGFDACDADASIDDHSAALLNHERVAIELRDLR